MKTAFAAWATAALLLVALVQLLVPGATEALVLTREGGLREPWRLVTGHGVHLNGTHLLWNALPFWLLARAVELRLGRRALGLLLAGGVLAVDLAVLSGAAGVEVYAGVSGVATGLFVAVALGSLREPERAGPLLGLLGLLTKLVYELVTGRYFFLDACLPGVAVPLAHAAGAGVGLLGLGWRGGARVRARSS